MRAWGKPHAIWVAGTLFAIGLKLYPKYHLKGENMFRTLTALLVVAFFASACNTMAGAGQDLERGGEKIQGAAERNK